MTESSEVPVADFKRDFARYASEVERGARIRVTRHGKPVGDFVPARAGVTELPVAPNPGGLAALVGILDDWVTMEADMAEVVRRRRRERARPAPSLD
jgi:prevent-host-death family protein